MNNFKKIIALFLLAAAQQSFYIIEACSAGTTPTRQDYSALLTTAGVSKGVITRAQKNALGCVNQI